MDVKLETEYLTMNRYTDISSFGCPADADPIVQQVATKLFHQVKRNFYINRIARPNENSRAVFFSPLNAMICVNDVAL
jgi:hypothetical protein